MEKTSVYHAGYHNSKELYLNFCGKSECYPGHDPKNPVRINHLLHYILGGSGTFWIHSEKYHLGGGQGFYIPPNTLVRYVADEDTPWHYIWVGFDGKMAESYMSKMGLSEYSPIFSCSQAGQLQDIIDQMLIAQAYSLSQEMRLQSLLYQFLGIVSECCDKKENNVNGKDSYTQGVIDYIQNNYLEQIHIRDIAAHIGLNRSYLSTYFAKETGQSPQQYLNAFRISKAKDFLILTDLSVEEIGNSCGFQNGVTFYRAFKKAEGISPTAFRLQEKQKLRKDTPSSG